MAKLVTKWLLIDFDNTQMATEPRIPPLYIGCFNELYDAACAGRAIIVGDLKQHLQETKVEMAPHIIETLASLEAKGYKFALVTNSPLQRCFTAMRHATNESGSKLANFFNANFFEAGAAQKPSPDVYLRAMEQLGIAPKDCFAIEDSVNGTTAAVTAGIRTFGFSGFADNPPETQATLLGIGAIECMSDWQQLPDLLVKYDLEG